jgi:uncharacterized protein YbbC (DUF1343 family)
MRAHACLSLMIAACAPGAPRHGSAAGPVRPGIEVLLSDSLHLVRGRRVGLLSNHTGVDREGRRDVDRLREAHVRVVALFSPEHGFRGTEDRPALPDAVDAASGLPIYSLYRGARPPTLTALDELDVVLIDLQDIGARYYTYVTTAAFLLREAARRGRPVIADKAAVEALRERDAEIVAARGAYRESNAELDGAVVADCIHAVHWALNS